MNKFSSLMDLPNSIPNPQLWVNDGDFYTLDRDVHRYIFETLYAILQEKFCYPLGWLGDLVIIGSNSTNQYTLNSDLDICVEVDLDRFSEVNPTSYSEDPETLKKKIATVVNFHVKEDTIPGTSVSPHFYVVGLGETLTSDGAYSMRLNKWIVPFRFVPIGFRPYQVFQREALFCLKLSQYLGRLLVDARAVTKIFLSSGVGFKSVSDMIKRLYFWESAWKEFRQRDSGPLLSDGFSQNWNYHNVVFKILESWGYIKPLQLFKEWFPELDDHVNSMVGSKTPPREKIDRTIDYLEKEYFKFCRKFEG